MLPVEQRRRDSRLNSDVFGAEPPPASDLSPFSTKHEKIKLLPFGDLGTN